MDIDRTIVNRKSIDHCLCTNTKTSRYQRTFLLHLLLFYWKESHCFTTFSIVTMHGYPTKCSIQRQIRSFQCRCRPCCILQSPESRQKLLFCLDRHEENYANIQSAVSSNEQVRGIPGAYTGPQNSIDYYAGLCTSHAAQRGRLLRPMSLANNATSLSELMHVSLQIFAHTTRGRAKIFGAQDFVVTWRK